MTATSRPPRALALTLALSALALQTGCGDATQAAPDRVEAHANLDEVGQMYALYVRENGKPPRKPADFERYAPGFANGALALQTGEVVARFGASPSESADGTQVLAYEKSVPERGGAALMLDGTVRELSAEDFASAPKAGDDPKPARKR